VRSSAFSVLLIAGAAACAPAAPSTGPSPDAGAPPVRALLSERDRLALSPDQVVALDSVSRALDVPDRADSRRGILKVGLVPRLGLAKPRGGRRDLAMKQSEAMRAVEQLLRPDQRRRLCELYTARQAKVMLREDKRTLANQRRGFTGSRRAETLRTWPWCSTAPHSATAQSDS
jgi:hypothetical protein